MERTQGRIETPSSGEIDEIDDGRDGRTDGGIDPAVREGTGEPGQQLVALSRDQFIERARAFRKQPTVERVELPWIGPGVHAFVRGMTSRERDEFEVSLVVKDARGDEKLSTENIRAKFLLRVLCREDGTRLFADQEVDALSGLDAKTSDALYSKGSQLSGVTKADIEDMRKNSDRALSAATLSRSDSKSSDVSRTS